HCLPARADVLLAKRADGRFVSFFGDLHPSFSGNVVRAFASTRQGYPVISRVLRKRPPASRESGARLFARGAQAIGLRDADRMIVIGSDRMMQAVARARRTTLSEHMKVRQTAIASINSPMQCMMKEICAQCLQPHRDQRTGARATCSPASIRTSPSTAWIFRHSRSGWRKTRCRRS
ncbi:MAG: hypothetical protein L0219_14740, partial [Phycisphaerales bacterium]|nr:hypothetical protein [Phycisphaerales bacterium]